MRARIFRRFLWSGFLLFAGTLLILEIYLERFTASYQQTDLRSRLEAVAGVLGAETVGPDRNEWVRTASQRSGLRVAILTRDGSVLADSLGNGRSEMSVIRPLSAPDSPAASVRVSAPLQEIDDAVLGLRLRLFGAALVSTLLAGCVAFVFVRSFSKRVDRLRRYVEGLLDPRLPGDELPAGDDGLGELARSLHRTAPQIRDLVQRLKLEGAQREAILASMVEGVLAVDKDLRVTFCNESLARTLGSANVARTTVPAGIPLTHFVRDPGLLEIMARVLKNGDAVEQRLTLSSTEAHSFEVLAGPFEGPTGRGALAILHDITKLERLERVRKDFVANVSHELRTPLASIRGYAETLLDGALDDSENNRKFVEIILAHSIRLNNIASDLLIISDLESAQAAKAQPKSVSVRASMESALRTVESGARVRQVRLVTDVMDDVHVMGHELRMEQAFVNLLDNAVKFNKPNGEVHIEVKGVDDAAVISVSDTGVGIPSEDVPRIFERFYRVDKARSRDVGGTGLGLSIVRHVVEQMAGAITVQSQLGKGSKFIIRLPAVCRVEPVAGL
ncbi:MAG TPA: ATP-binding protein [Bryobacteraceae bacterium]|nr:ATP-binding protein [Bryobacteraceae bacterium]